MSGFRKDRQRDSHATGIHEEPANIFYQVEPGGPNLSRDNQPSLYPWLLWKKKSNTQCEAWFMAVSNRKVRKTQFSAVSLSPTLAIF